MLWVLKRTIADKRSRRQVTAGGLRVNINSVVQVPADLHPVEGIEFLKFWTLVR